MITRSHDFSLLSLDTFLHPFFEINFEIQEKKFLETKKFHFRSLIFMKKNID